VTSRNRTIALVPVSTLLLLGSCGGGGESSKQTVRPSGATGPAGSKSASREPYRTSPTAPKPARDPGAKKTEAKRNGKKKTPAQSGGASPSLPSSSPAAAPSPTIRPQEVLARKAKRICESLGIDALAAKYNVEATPEAVATAYAASYPPIFRAAVHDSCRSAFSRR
jgi:hypothetical protein